jgi:hypothetical protein
MRAGFSWHFERNRESGQLGKKGLYFSIYWRLYGNLSTSGKGFCVQA